MSDIKVGDLVYVAYRRICCGMNGSQGAMFVVSWIGEVSGFCEYCGGKRMALAALYKTEPHRDVYIELSRLEKFKDFPKEELRETTTDLPVTA